MVDRPDATPPAALLPAAALAAAGTAQSAGPWRREFEQGAVRIAEGRVESSSAVWSAVRPAAIAAPERSNAAPVSVALARWMLRRMLGTEHPMLAHRADSRAMFARGQSADAAEGIAAFLQKRAPEFTDHVSDGLPEIMPDWVAPEFR